VFGPTAVTSAFPSPVSINVLFKIKGLSYYKFKLPLNSYFFLASASPVNVDSLQLKLEELIKMQSAGTAFPFSKVIMSPTTSSSASIVVNWPPRVTIAVA
jgi:hypothetical protein